MFKSRIFALCIGWAFETMQRLATNVFISNAMQNQYDIDASLSLRDSVLI